MRELTSHIVNPANDKLKITVHDEPGAGGAHHLYMIDGFSTQTNGSCKFLYESLEIPFQNGPINEHGVNGVTHEALLAILIDRLECFQAGPFACQPNAMALLSLKAAQHHLQERTKERMARGVEGTHNV